MDYDENIKKIVLNKTENKEIHWKIAINDKLWDTGIESEKRGIFRYNAKENKSLMHYIASYNGLAMFICRSFMFIKPTNRPVISIELSLDYINKIGKMIEDNEVESNNVEETMELVSMILKQKMI
jgi:hypothetical protein